MMLWACYNRGMKPVHLHEEQRPAGYFLTVTFEDRSIKTYKGDDEYITRLIREYKKSNKSLVHVHLKRV